MRMNNKGRENAEPTAFGIFLDCLWSSLPFSLAAAAIGILFDKLME